MNDDQKQQSIPTTRSAKMQLAQTMLMLAQTIKGVAQQHGVRIKEETKK